MLTSSFARSIALPFSLALQIGARGGVARVTARDLAADSVRVLRGAKSAQHGFEITRRANLPITTDGPSGRCQVTVGRMCYWWTEGEWEPPAEPGRIRAARAGLLDRLAAASERLPGDAWIAGQRVRYLVEDGRTTDAIDAARACQAAASWCAALTGFAHHAAGDFARADSAYTAALGLMTEKARCEWTDISLLLENDARDRYQRASCAERHAIEDRFWALARPLYLLPANDLRTEHFARLTMAELIRTSRFAHNMTWGDDMRELLVRYGWETHWARRPAMSSSYGGVDVVGQEPTPSYDFAPDPEVVLAPVRASSTSWAFLDPQAQARYAPAYARSIRGLEHQLAFFRRGDLALVIAAYDLTRDSLFTRDTIAAALALAPAAAPESAAVVRDTTARRRGVLMTSAAWGAPTLVSVEARDSVSRRVARARTVIQPTTTAGRLAISDLLLFDDPRTLPATLEDAAPRARGSYRIPRETPVGVFWEMYGIDEGGETLAYTLTVTRTGAAWYRRAAEKVGVVDRRPPVRLEWQEPSAGPGAARSRALSLDLSMLAEGTYRVELALETAGAKVATAFRDVEVVR